MLCKIPPEAEKNQPELLVWITLQRLSRLTLQAFHQNLLAKFSSKPKLQGYFRYRLFVSFLLILEILFTTAGNGSESYIIFFENSFLKGRGDPRSHHLVYHGPPKALLSQHRAAHEL